MRWFRKKKRAESPERMETPSEVEIEEMVANLSDWYSKQPHLPQIDDTDLLRKFLVNCKYRVQKTKSKLDGYFTARTKLPNVFLNRDPCDETIRKIGRLCPFFPLEKTTVDGEVAFVTTADPDCSEIVAMDFVRRLMMVLDVALLEQKSQLNFIVIIDYSGFSFSHFLQLITITKLTMDLMIEIYPGRLRSLHAVNCPSFMDKIVALYNMMVKGPLRERLFIHNEFEKLHAAVGREFLPKDLGGDEPTIAEVNDAYQKKVESYKDWFKSQEEVKSNEDLRPASKSWFSFGSSSTDEIDEGAFRKLTVD